MTRQAFLAQMLVPPPSTSSPPFRPPAIILLLSLSSLRAIRSRSLSLAGPLSPPSHQKSRAIALGGLSTLTDSPVPYSRETCTRSTVFGALTTTTTDESKPLCPYTPLERALTHKSRRETRVGGRRETARKRRPTLRTFS